MSDPVLSQLVSVESDLAQQANSLESQLAQIQAQREGLRTVINMFEEGDDSEKTAAEAAKPVTETTQKPSRPTDSSSSAKTSSAKTSTAKTSSAKAGSAKTSSAKAGSAKTSSAKASSAKTSSAKAGSAKTSSAKTARKADSKSSAKKPGRKPKPSVSSEKASQKKKDGRAADWQKYVQPEYRESALPEAVSSVLRSSPSEVFKIADVMSTIFIEDVPRDQFLKARNRISNILSAGARDGSWYRGRNGRYSQSESATK